MKKRLVSTLLALCMVVGLMPSIAYADDPDISISEYEENRVISEYSGYRNEDASGNHWSYDAATDTLTLNNFRGNIFIHCSRVILIGENTTTRFMCHYATVEGSGSLRIIAGASGSFVLDDQLQMIGGTYYDDRMPLTMKDGRVVQPDGTEASHIRIEPNPSSSKPATTPTQPTATEKPATSTGFTGVADNAWYREAVEYVSKPVYAGCGYGLMDSATATEFSPNTNADRATIVTALCRRFNFDIEGNPNYDKEFSDVPDKLGAVVYWAVSSGVVTGYGDGTFGPYDPVTREQFAVMLYRYVQSKNGWRDASVRADLSAYSDSSQISTWAVEAMSWANASGYITGATSTTLNPKGNITRAEVATILLRLL